MSHNKKKGGRSLTKLALFEERDKIHPRNETYEGLENFTGLVPKRSKTDLFFLIVYILCIIAVAILFYFAFSTHDFNRLGRGFDFRGDICGKPGTTVAEKEFLYFEDPINVGNTGICVYACPKTDGAEICFYDVDGVTLLDDYCYSSYTTTAIGKFCLPPQMGTNRTIIESYTKATSELLKTVGGDLYMAWDIFLIALVFTLAFGTVFILGFFCDITRKVTLWICVLGAGVLGTGLCAFFVLDYQKMVENECEGGVYASGCIGIKAFLLIALAVITILSLIGFYFYIIKNRDKIKFVLKRSSADVLLKPIKQVKTMLLFLIFQYALQVIVTAFFFFAAVVLLASGQLTLINKTTVSDFPNDKFFVIRQPSYIYVALAFFILMFLWTMGNILLFGRMVITSAVSTWYFSREKSILDLPIFRGLKFITRFHIGSIAYGSVCVALNWPFKSFFGIIKNRLKKIRNRKSRTFKFWMSTCNVTLTFYELVLKYVSNKNLMQTAIFGEEFCVAGVRVFYLKYRNESRLKLLKNTIGYYLMLGKVFISLVVTLISYNFLLFNKKSLFGQDLSYLQFAYVPALLILLITMFVAQTFTSLFDLVIDAIFFCFVCDEEMYTGKQRYAEQELREFMDQFGKEAKKQDDDLDVRARPKQFKGEDENSLIEDNIFVTEQHKNPAKESDNKKLANAQEDDHKDDHDDHDDHEDDADPQAYKVLNVDDAVSAVSDHHIHSVSDVTSRSRWQPPKSDHKDEESGFQVVNFGNFNQKADSDEDEDEHNNNNGTKLSGFTPDASRVGFGLKDAKQRIGNRANRMKNEEEGKEDDEEDEDEDGGEEEEEGEGEEEEEEDDEEVKQESQRKPKERVDDSEDDEDEEDLEQGEDPTGNKNNKKKAVTSKIGDQNKISSRIDALYKLRNVNSNKKNESKSGDKKTFIF